MNRSRRRNNSRNRNRHEDRPRPAVVAAVAPLPVLTPEPTTLTPEQFGGLTFKDAKSYAFSLYGIKARSKAALLAAYIEARG